ncbi:MAG: hypothetical protein COZ11_10480 [Deltaproteobacteria bacterium CG_4_10_14_3_um_filter_51_14]|nr:MAG: hypothetical protein COZ11_10480 [Deltaproteobacteria bacterium CG_4_10_14_3_um_filter_51_14]
MTQLRYYTISCGYPHNYAMRLKKFLAPQGGSESFPEVQPDHGKTLCTARFPGNTILGYAFPAS